jgi:ABC-type long-subunit fatty acid transport system fused permease/ATPase subunit
MENQLLVRILARLYIFRDEVVARDMIVPTWAIDSIQEIEAAQQSVQADGAKSSAKVEKCKHGFVRAYCSECQPRR